MDIIYCDSAIEADWFKGLDPRLGGICEEKILRRGSNPAEIEKLISYDRPDIILVRNNSPRLVVEKTREVPTGHNVGQRVARLVKAVELEVPVIKYFPYDARKHGVHSSICNLNIRLLEAFDSMWQIHKTPIIGVNWPCTSSGELVNNGQENFELEQLISAFVDSDFENADKVFLPAREKMRYDYQQRLKKFPKYGQPPPSVVIKKTQSFIGDLPRDLQNNVNQIFAKRDKTVIYTIKMNENKCRREDPYTGTQFVYDYCYCRVGPSRSDRLRNLVLHFPRIRKEVWLNKNPNNSARKRSNWYLAADSLVFKDGVIQLT